jgi:hypothetical protein
MRELDSHTRHTPTTEAVENKHVLEKRGEKIKGNNLISGVG